MARTAARRRATAKDAQRTWIVVADGGRARVLESARPHSGVTIRLEATSDARKTAGKLADDRLPRTQESATPARHGIAPRVSLKEHEKRLFATCLANYLNGGVGSFDRLVLVAPLRFLNLVREVLPDNVARKISMTWDKDLTWMTDTEVLSHIGFIGREVGRLRQVT